MSSPSIPLGLHGFAGRKENVNLENRERVGVLWSLLQPPQELILSKKRNSRQNSSEESCQIQRNPQKKKWSQGPADSTDTYVHRWIE